MKWSKQRHALLACGSLALLAAQAGCADTAVQSTPFPGVQAAQPSPEELDRVVAPIALYPDALVAQILAASSYPADIVEAYRWMQQHHGLNSGELAQSLDQQAWDPSVKALAQFPSVLASMDKNLSWTSALGDAYDNEPEEVLDAVQVMRRRAQEAGNLNSTPQETVTTEGQSIVIQPANPDVVYVPEYDPWLAYGAPLGAYPDWAEVPGAFVAGSSVLAGPGVEVGNFEGFGWGWGYWGADWHDDRLVYNHDTYISHSPTFTRRYAFNRGHADFAHFGAFQGGMTRGQFGIHSGAFSGFDHGGFVTAYSSRGRLSYGGGFHAGGFHGGGSDRGGSHGGGGRR